MKTRLSVYLILIAGLAVSAQALSQEKPAPASEKKAEALEQRVVELTNAERIAAGLLPLKRQENLDAAASWLAQDMAAKDYFAHEDKLGRSIDPRLPDFGYTRFRLIAENIAAGQKTPEAVVKGWLKSTGHRRNILSPDLTEIGVGYASAPRGRFRRFWVQDFGARRDVYPVIINGEAARAKTPEVTLHVHGAGWAEQMRFSNDGTAWGRWEPYRRERQWTLEPGHGPRTVFAQLRGPGGVLRSQDSIHLDAAPAAP